MVLNDIDLGVKHCETNMAAYDAYMSHIMMHMLHMSPI